MLLLRTILLLFVAFVSSNLVIANQRPENVTTASDFQDDLQRIAAPIPEEGRKELFGNVPQEKFSCIHALNQSEHHFADSQLSVNENDNKFNNEPTTTVDPTLSATGFITPNISSDDLQLDWKVIDSFTLSSFEAHKVAPTKPGNKPSIIAPHLEVLHRWIKLPLPFSDKATYSMHDLKFRIVNTTKEVAVWSGYVTVRPDVGIYHSRWLGSSINMFDPRYVVNVSWNIHSIKGQACWFGDSVSYEPAFQRSVRRWTHLIEYPGNNSWSGFVVIKNLLTESQPTQFWAGHGNSTVDVLSKSNWKDYTPIWLGIEEDQSNAAKNLSRGWIWTMFTTIFFLCVVFSWLVFWLTRERIDSKSGQQTSWKAILNRARNRRRSSADDKRRPSAPTLPSLTPREATLVSANV